jgi:dihydrofolate reductase
MRSSDRPLIAAMNMTLDGYCDHTAMNADDEIHAHYSEMLRNAGILIYGRITYQLMESYWPAVVQEPTGNASTDDFAVLIDDIQKIVYSRTLDHVDWKNSTLKHEINADEIIALKHQPGKPIFAGSPSMIVALSNLGLVDEYQIAIHPVIAGSGLVLFKNIAERIDLKLTKTKTFGGGAVVMYYSTNQAG